MGPRVGLNDACGRAGTHAQSSRRRACAVPVVLLVWLAACQHEVLPDFSPPFVCATDAPLERSIFFIGDAGDPLLSRLTHQQPNDGFRRYQRKLIDDMAGFFGF